MAIETKTMSNSKAVTCDCCGEISKDESVVPKEWVCFCSKVCAWKWGMDQDITKEPIASIPYTFVTTDLKALDRDAMSESIAAQIERGGESQPYGN